MNNPQKDLIFALDIGTRNVIGILGEARGEKFHVLYMVKEEHSKRAMVDGQIEDIDQVAKVVSIVKERLEEQVGHVLTRVCVAAAGRSLRMERARAMVELPEVQPITDDYISQLEAVAIAEAEEKLSEHHKDQRFYLVGYTVAQYMLDRYPMTTIKGHNGKTMEAEVVATFLPSQVVEGLYSVVQIAGMEVASLTLEPIAALNATIPPDLRLLNLVLVDIGAGTSDIAVCRDGSVVGYTMATTAGDEITEMLMRHFLIDFQTAESLKTNLSAGDIKYVNVLGAEESTNGHQIAEAIAEASKSLVKEISKEIRAINGCAPSAVFMAGGGSKLEGITSLLAEYLEIQPHRIAVAGSNYNRTVESDNFQLEDPEYATPLGIAVSAALGLINDSYHITLNGKGAKLFRSGSLTLLDILMMNGYTAAALIGRTGKNLAIMINGNKKIIRGKASVPGILRLNGQAAVAGALVSAGDSIEFIPAIDGQSASSTLQELLGDYSGKVLLNGEEVSWDTQLKNGDSITTINSNVSPTTMRKGARPLSVDEVKPVDSQGNPMPIPGNAYQQAEITETFLGIQADFDSLSDGEIVAKTIAMSKLPMEEGPLSGNPRPMPQERPPMVQKPQAPVAAPRQPVAPTPPPMQAAPTAPPMQVAPTPPPMQVAPTPPPMQVAPTPPPVQGVPPMQQAKRPEPPLRTPQPVVVEKPRPIVRQEMEESTLSHTASLPTLSISMQDEDVKIYGDNITPIPVKPENPEPPLAQAPMFPPMEEMPKKPAPTVVPEPVQAIQDQIPVEEGPVMPTGPLPHIADPVAETEPRPLVKPIQRSKPVEPKAPVGKGQMPEQPLQMVSKPVDSAPKPQPVPQPVPQAPVPQPVPQPRAPQPVPVPQSDSQVPVATNQSKPALTQGTIVLNGESVNLPPKADGSPYYLMDLLDKTDIDFRRVSKPILMMVNGQEGFFVQHLHANDDVIIEEQS